MQTQTEVFVQCQDCYKYYIQRVTGQYIGPRKRAPNYAPQVQERCKEHGQTNGKDSWYGLMRCTECSVRRAPPVLRDTVRKWLQEGERSL